MAFDKYDIIGALRTYCNYNSLRFVWQYDQFYANIENQWNDFQPNELILVADLRATPNMGRGSKEIDISYSGLFMLGRKFEAITTTSSSLDETALEKYDNRILDLYSLLILHATNFKCLHELDLTIGQLDPLFNEHDANIDFVVATDLTYVQ